MSPQVPVHCAAHLRNPVLHLDSLVTFLSDLVEVWNIKPEMIVISEVQVESAQFRLRNWCDDGCDLDHVQQSHSIGDGPHIRLLLLCQDYCPQYLFIFHGLFHGLTDSLRGTVGLGVER